MKKLVFRSAALAVLLLSATFAVAQTVACPYPFVNRTNCTTTVTVEFFCNGNSCGSAVTYTLAPQGQLGDLQMIPCTCQAPCAPPTSVIVTAAGTATASAPPPSTDPFTNCGLSATLEAAMGGASID